ncbi:hypothetical protein QQZ08_010855 [Neonectria magnoliae]|uniref:Aminoglycoside phosphotransferase domain-containing protein n=1 Tax=Neonectria magnoliae TaxID=2732573 RepID=A0ABR1HES0_9HYPO
MPSIIDHIPRIPWIAAIFGKLVTTWNALWFVWPALRIRLRSSTTQHTYPLTYEQQVARKKQFIDGIDQDAIRKLASWHNNWKPCRIFHSTHGSFNACFFVEFPDDNTKWVVRIPIKPAVHDVWAKLQSEVTTMRYIQSETTIPLPRVHAFGRDEILTRARSTTQAYLILDYVPGQSLDVQSLTKDTRERRNHFYSQLIDILAQMRQLVGTGVYAARR